MYLQKLVLFTTLVCCVDSFHWSARNCELINGLLQHSDTRAGLQISVSMCLLFDGWCFNILNLNRRRSAWWGLWLFRSPTWGPTEVGWWGRRGQDLLCLTKIVPIIESFNFPKYRHSFSVYVPSSACESANDSLLLWHQLKSFIQLLSQIQKTAKWRNSTRPLKLHGKHVNKQARVLNNCSPHGGFLWPPYVARCKTLCSQDKLGCCSS